MPAPLHDTPVTFGGTGHGVSVAPSPSALHWRRDTDDPHVTLPGVQVHATQLPSRHV